MAGEGEIVGGWPEMNEGWWTEVNGGGIARETARNRAQRLFSFLMLQ